eukprot:TRINITY_DN31591_c0_g2_i1.p1 TRINITY_DN31591_c0_g2~~TRINITY_DN31591_c0_g2_i1.p1  ORF type:complete len:373 (-),score=55.71 TRINITY_DN31591_c0_g2_i1:357-1475(-)
MADGSNGVSAGVLDGAIDSEWSSTTKYLHIALAVLSALPLIIRVQANYNVIMTACLTVYIGACRSVKPQPPEEGMAKKDAYSFPLVGSVTLLGLYLVFKVLSKDLVNLVLTIYFSALGVLAITGVMLPFFKKLFPQKYQDMIIFKARSITIPVILKEPVEIQDVSLPFAIGLLPSACVAVWYGVTKHWLGNNILGLAFSIEGIEYLSLGTTQNGVILLAGLFVYDIFWVFCTPVMVTVAKQFEVPIKLLFPRGIQADAEKKPYSMLGLGDIIIPGIWVALMLRYDKINGYKTQYFQSSYIGYCLGLFITIIVMNIFQAAQPALLYIVPCVLAAVFGLAAVRNETKKVYSFVEVEEPKEETDGQATKEEKKDQ